MTPTNCVNTWCKYHSGFYCTDTCKIYIPIGTQLKDINKCKLTASDYVLYLDSDVLARGSFEDIIKGHENDIVKSCMFDWNTCCITI